MTTPPACPSRPQWPVVAHFPVNTDEAVTLVAVTNAVPLARRLVGEVLRHWHLPASLAEDHEVVISELMTNALNATLDYHKARGLNEVGRLKLKLRWNAPSLFTEVWDINPLLPVRIPAEDLDIHHRGLGIIEFMCARWDAIRCREGGKVVWTEQRVS